MQQIKSFPSKKDFVYNALKNAILNNELEPGTKLIIDDLSAKLGVSQIPVREALQKLQADGLVTIEPYVGARVTRIDAALICEVFDLLESMEVISSRAACRKMSEAGLNELELLLQKMDTLTDDPDGFSEENMRLHQFLCDQAEMQLVKELMMKVMAQWDRLRRYYLNDVFTHRIKKAGQEHWEIFAALRVREPTLVEQVIRSHNKTSRAAYIAYLEATGQLPVDNS